MVQKDVTKVFGNFSGDYWSRSF